ncbi:MAG: hypothetical protein R6U32_05120 [Candidatus Woesearchaeota archaeon]
MEIHLVKFFILFIAGLALLVFSETVFLDYLSYLIIIVSVYFLVTAMLLRKNAW